MMETTVSEGANALQVGGDHYKTSYQHWDMLVSLGYASQYYVGQATKYITRWRKKNGVRDLRKGQHFVQKLIELTQKHGRAFLQFGTRSDADCELLVRKHADAHLREYFKANDVGIDEQAICVTLIFANGADQLRDVSDAIEVLIKRAIEAGEDVKSEVEVPVSVGYEFMGYTDHDTIQWRKKATQEVLDLPLTTPPMHGNWAA